MLKKPGVLSPSYSNLHSLFSHQSTHIHISASFPQSYQSRYSRRTKPPLRCLVHRQSDKAQAPLPQDPLWPDLPSPYAVPTPYQIFRIKKNSPYSKLRFYELVKIYHPDRNRLENIDVLSRSTKIERYRLIVAAHEILSDPVKRCAYDKSGAGWDSSTEDGAQRCNWGQSNSAGWSGFDTNDSPFRNATWEDWERWYRRDEAKQEPLYFSNGGFLMLVITAVFLAGLGQSIRLGDYSNLFQRHVEKVHDDASIAIRQRKIESQGFENRDERLQNFLRSRGPRGYGFTDPVKEGYRKLLPEPELCMNQNMYRRGHDRGRDSKP